MSATLTIIFSSLFLFGFCLEMSYFSGKNSDIIKPIWGFVFNYSPLWIGLLASTFIYPNSISQLIGTIIGAAITLLCYSLYKKGLRAAFPHIR